MTTTQEIIEQVANKIGHPIYNPVSASALAPIFGVSRAHLWRLREGNGVLSRDAFVRACKFLELPPEKIVELTLALDADGSEDEGMRAYIRNIAKKLRPGIAKSGACILIGAAAMLAHVEDARASGNLVLSAHDAHTGSGPASSRSLYIMVSRIRRFLRHLLHGTTSHIPPRPALA